MHWKGIEAATAEQLLQNTQGHLGKAMIYLNNPVKN
jgi:hypothetical protein